MANSDEVSIRLDFLVLFEIITSWQGFAGRISHNTAMEQQRDRTEYVDLIVLGEYLRFAPFERVSVSASLSIHCCINLGDRSPTFISFIVSNIRFLQARYPSWY